MTKNSFMLTTKEIEYSEALAMTFYKAKNLSRYGIDYDEVKSAAYLALTEAALHFDKKRGTKFTTYAYPCIQREMMRLLKSYVKHSTELPSDQIRGLTYEDEHDEFFIEDMEEELIDYIVKKSIKKYKKETKEQLKVICRMMMAGLPPKDIAGRTNMEVSRINLLTQRFRSSARQNKEVIIDSFF